jgi:hypothetical protein
MQKILKIATLWSDCKSRQSKSVYSAEGIAPTVYNYAGGGNLVPMVLIEAENEDERCNSSRSDLRV